MGNPLTKDEYEKGDRIIATRLPEFKANHLGTVTRVLKKGGYTIKYDIGGSEYTEHKQILGLTFPFNKSYPNYIKDKSLRNYLFQRVLPEDINNIRTLMGNPRTKPEYVKGDRIIVKFKHPTEGGNYYATVIGSNKAIYSINYDEIEGLWPTEHIQILGLTDRPTCGDPIPDDKLIDYLQQTNGIQRPKPHPEPPSPEDTPKKDSEREVENNFILPLLYRLGYNKKDIHRGRRFPSRNHTIKVDFALFDHDNNFLERPLLIVEAKCENKLILQSELKKAQDQVRHYACCSYCHFGLVTDSKVLQIIDLSKNNPEIHVMFDCKTEELENKFDDIHQMISKERLIKHYGRTK
jgi:hypothetical protein